jgi:two-component system OmpR family response regulator/two-component system alkaline phosphatase synthesis response regulator PhoP
MAATTETKKKIILIVEDDLFLIRAYQIKFEKEGFEVWVASDGNLAMARLQGNPPDIVLLDLMLPGVNGFDILEDIRKSPKWKDVPVIILTNLGQEQDKKKGEALGVKDYIVKANVKISEVVERVKKYVA